MMRSAEVGLAGLVGFGAIWGVIPSPRGGRRYPIYGPEHHAAIQDHLEFEQRRQQKYSQHQFRRNGVESTL